MKSNSEKFKNKYRISSARLQSWDYGNNGSYFITICTKNREHFFGEIFNEKMHLNEIGKMADKYWKEIPKHFPFIELGNYVVMPNHVHGILTIIKNRIDQPSCRDKACDKDKACDRDKAIVSRDKACLVSTTTTHESNKTNGQMRYQNQGKKTISSVTGSYKSVVTKNAHLINSDFAWQPRFHDHVIRDAESFERIQIYIKNNPKNWKEDKFYY